METPGQAPVGHDGRRAARGGAGRGVLVGRIVIDGIAGRDLGRAGGGVLGSLAVAAGAARPRRARAARPCRWARRTRPASTRRCPPSLKSHLLELPGRAHPELRGPRTKITAKPPVEDRLHRLRDHEPVQRGRADSGCSSGSRSPRQAASCKGSLITNIPDRPWPPPSAERADLRDSADGVAGRQRDHPAARGQRRRGPGHRRRRQGGRPGHPGRHPARDRTRRTPSSAWSQNQVEADAGALGLIKKGNIVIVKGIAGNENDVVLYNQAIADLKNCPQHPRRRHALRQLGPGDGQDRRGPVHRLAPVSPWRASSRTAA